MADTSTTDGKLEEQAVEEPQLGLENEPEADNQQDEPSQPESEAEAPEQTEPETEEVEEEVEVGQGETDELDSELLEWAEKKGLPTDNPTKILKSYREAEKALHSKSNEVSELRNQVTSQAEKSGDEYESPETIEQRKLAGETRATLFYINNPEAKDYDKEMAEIIQQKPYLVNDLDVAYAYVQQKNQAKDTQKARQQGKREALESTAKAQRSQAAKASATTQESVRKITDDDIAKMSQAEYNAWAQENDPFSI